MGYPGQPERHEPPAARGEVRAETDHGRPGVQGDLHVRQRPQQRPAEGLRDRLLRRPHRQEGGEPVRGGSLGQGGAFGGAEGEAQERGGGEGGQMLDVDADRGGVGRAGGREGGDRHRAAVGRREHEGRETLPRCGGGTAEGIGSETESAGVPVQVPWAVGVVGAVVGVGGERVAEQGPAVAPARRHLPDVPPEVHPVGQGAGPGVRRRKTRHAGLGGRRRRARRPVREGARGRWRAFR